jgi:hypothetical protein
MNTPKDQWRVSLVELRFLWAKDPIRPADLSHKLRDIMLAKNNLIEDAEYQKVVPNRFLIELNPDNFTKNYQPIQKRVIQQLQEKLLSDLERANTRQGRREYNFAGRVEIQIGATEGLGQNQARIYYQVGWQNQNRSSQLLPPELLLPAFLELVPGGKRWRLHRGIVTIGRDPENDVILDHAEIQARRLISGQHASIECGERKFVLHDGSPAGRPSTNGTYLNLKRVGPEGALLKDGDLILLAALQPSTPRPDTPGVAVLRFTLEPTL